MQEIIEASVRETVEAFLCNPFQFHGDTGIMHYLYHRMMVHGGDSMFKESPNGTKTLLLQSEHHTTLTYLGKGRTPTPARMDYALLSPESIPPSGKVPRKNMPADIGFEVGRNKGVCAMGDLAAGQDCPNARPGDAVKLIRELRFPEGMKAAYLLEFYDSSEYLEDARAVLGAVVSACDNLPDDKALYLVVVVRGDSGLGDSWVATHPRGWLAGPLAGFSELPKNVPASTITASSATFLEKCGPSNVALLRGLKSNFGTHCVWGRISMTVRRPPGFLWMRVTNREHPEGESIQEIHPRLAKFLEEGGIEVIEGDRVDFPDQTDDRFVSQVIAALGKTLDGPSPQPTLPILSKRDKFLSVSSPGNQALLRRVEQEFASFCTWGQYTMSIGPPNAAKPVYIHNKGSKEGEVVELKPAALAVLRSKQVDLSMLDVVPNGHIRIQESSSPHFIKQVVYILREVLGGERQ